MAVSGVRLMLFHPTATRELWEVAKTCTRTTTSWNGALLQRDIKINNRKESIVTEVFDDILKILKKHNVTCDIGTVFRPTRISEALDSVHRMELSLQEKYIEKAKEIGVFTIREGGGHIPLNKIEAFCKILNNNSTPLMSFAVSTDAAMGFDHVACVIATTFIGNYSNLGIINPVTRAEHTSEILKLADILEALMSAKVVAHSLDIKNIPATKELITLFPKQERLTNVTRLMEDYLNGHKT
jgi:phosphomethylpyrimidine synthase